MPNKLTQEEYITRCVEAHGSLYGLQHIVYKNSSSKVAVECKKHGIFSVNASTFMRGTGCAKCAWEQNGLNHRLTQDEFLATSVKMHGDSYNYKNTVYTRSDLKIEIWCNSCENFFSITPEAHLAGQGCKACGYKKNGENSQISFDTFVEQSNKSHNGRFSYEHVRLTWKGIKTTKFNLYCDVHEETFSTTASRHIKGAGCPRCSKILGGIKNRSNTEQFISEAVGKFGDVFDYSRVEYTKSNIKVEIRCVAHDRWFSVTPNVHLHPDNRHGGCPECVQAGYKTAKPGYLYVLHVDELTKIGITNRSPEARCKSVARESSKNFEVLTSYYFTDGAVPRDIETILLRELKELYNQPYERFDGYRETFYNVNLPQLLNRIEQLISQQTAAQAALKEQHSSNLASQEA
jgi:hypothetical protein